MWSEGKGKEVFGTETIFLFNLCCQDVSLRVIYESSSTSYHNRTPFIFVLVLGPSSSLIRYCFIFLLILPFDCQTCMSAIFFSKPWQRTETARIRADKPVESHKNSGLGEDVQPPRPPQSEAPRLVLTEIRGVLKILKYLTINPTYVFTVCSTVPDVLLINSFAAFLPKLLENQFMVTSSTATIITG